VAFDFATYLFDRLPHAKKSSGAEIVSSCPWCGKPERFYANSESGAFICFKCHEHNESKGSHIYGLVAKLEGITDTEARAWVARRMRDFRARRSPDVTPETLGARLRVLRGIDGDALEAGSTKIAVDPPAEFIPVYRDGKWSVPKYLGTRGITRDTARHFGMGYATSGLYARRLILPFDCPNGRSFTARALDRAMEPRYRNPPDSGFSRLVYGWLNASPGADLVIVEGPLDAVGCYQHGIAAIALMGKALSDAQLAMIAKLRPSAVTVMLDPEEEIAPTMVALRLVAVTDRVSIAKLEGKPDDGSNKLDPGNANGAQLRAAIVRAERFGGGAASRLSSLRSRLARLTSEVDSDR